MTRHSRRAFLIVPILAMVLAVIGCSSHITNNRSSGGTVTDPTQPATVYLDQARQLITDIAQAVSPGAKLVSSEGTSDEPAVKCERPVESLVNYSISRDFDAPEGRTGADLIPAIVEQFHRHGFQTGTVEAAGWTSVPASTKYVGASAMGDPNSRTVRIGIDTRCGLPAPNGGDPGTESATLSSPT